MKNDTIQHIINRFIESYPSEKNTNTTWLEPIVGFVSAQNPLLDQFKEIIQPEHLTPLELLSGAKSIIVYFIPFAKEIHAENYREEFYCSRSWALAYLETNLLISELNTNIQAHLEKFGYKASLIPPTHNFSYDTLMSNWSHRHIAYLAGIGTFGHHNLLITKNGCAGRLGSLFTDLLLEPTAQINEEFCLHKAGYKCLKCVERCQYGALQAKGFDRFLCYKQCQINNLYHKDLDLTDICGKCSAMVPCSVVNPLVHARR